MKLYDELATDFSNSRAYPWKGWAKVKEYVEESQKKPFSVLDLGCGNGRFADFLKTEKMEFENYLGIDNSKELLQIAEERHSRDKVQFMFGDLEESWENNLTDKFDVIVIFGVMHHISTSEKRVELLKKMKSLLDENGVIIVTYWQFGKYPRFTDKAESLGNNDYLLPFNGESKARFCHFVDEQEATELEKQAGCEVVTSYYSDGSDEQLNLYRFYK